MLTFSIIIPCYNSAASIKRCIDSLIDQEYKNFEVLIQDNKSTDDTISILRSYQDKRINIYIEHDDGIYDAMNKAIECATGEWLLFLGSDDWLFDNQVLKKVSKVTKKTTAKVLYGDVKIVGDCSWAKDGELYRGKTSTNTLFEHNICHQAMFYQKSLFDHGLRYNLKYPFCSDHDLNLNIASKHAMRYLDITVANFSGGGTSSIRVDKALGRDMWLNNVKNFGFKLFNCQYRNHKSKIKSSITPFLKKGQYILAFKATVTYVYLKACYHISQLLKA